MTNTKLIWICSLLLASSVAKADKVNESMIIAPPSIDQETKGVPATPEEAVNATRVDQAATEKASPKSVFGESKITESRRESGQVYLIELEHSSGSKQYIEENDSDGKIQSTSNDIEETPNLPKWKLGSW